MAEPDDKVTGTYLVPAWLTKLPAQTRRLVKAIVPLLLSQSARASQAYAEHLRDMGSAEAFKQAVVAEAQSYSGVRKKLIARLATANEEERIAIRGQLRFIEEEARRSRIYLAAFERTSTEETASKVDDHDNHNEEISASWLDRFDEYARRVNEPWRSELLAKALAKEAQSPGSFGLRALWVIGTMEESVFHAFASILDLCATVGQTLMIPHPVDFEQTIPDCALGNVSLGHLGFLLDDLGLLGDLANAGLSRKKGIPIHVSYWSDSYAVTFNSNGNITGVLLTQLGRSVAGLYDRKRTEHGAELFGTWLRQLVATKKAHVEASTRASN